MTNTANTEPRPFNADSAMFGHTGPDTAYVVDDYPYGFTARTSIRYWVETKAKFGDRFVSQTLNPKTGKWNKPKPGTYSPIAVMYRDAVGHITHASLSTWSEAEWLEHFRSVVDGKLNPGQLRELALILAVLKVQKTVTVTIYEGSFTPEEQAEQDATKAQIGQAIARTAGRIHAELAS